MFPLFLIIFAASKNIWISGDYINKRIYNHYKLKNEGLWNKIDALREENSTFKSSAMTSQIVGQAVAPINQVLAGLQNEVAGIKCKLPETVTTPYSPFTAVPIC